MQNKSNTRVQLLLLTWVLIISMILAYWLQRSIGSQGRLVFPAISSLVILLVIGLNFFFKKLPTFSNGSNKNRLGWLRPLAWTSLPLILAGSSIYALTTLIPQAYGAPLAVESVPAATLEIDVTYGDFEYFQILGLEIPQARYEIGDEVPITVYMRTAESLQQNYQIFIQFLNPQGSEVANLTSHPGWGRNPTSLWKPGAIYVDTYPVRVNGPIEQQSPLLARVYIGFVDPITEESGRFPVAAVDKTGRKIDPMLSTVALSSQLADSKDAAEFPANAPQFGDVIQLSSSKFPTQIPASGSTLAVTLIWDAIGTPIDEYVAYVHLLNQSGERVAGMDQPPAAGRMPTNYWQSGDRIYSGFILTLPNSLPTGDYTLWSGLYEADSQGSIRLPVTEANGHQVEHNQVLLGAIRR